MRRSLNLEKNLKANETQATFDFVADLDRESIRGFIKCGLPYDNVALYELGIKSGILPRDIRNELIKLEEDGRVEVVALPAKKRNRKGFYIDYNHHKKGDRTIAVTFKR